MIIDDAEELIVVEIQDAKFYFAQPVYHEFLKLVESNSDADKRETFEKLVRVEGLTSRNGDTIDADGIRTLNIPTTLAFKIVRGYNQAWRRALGIVEAEPKKELTSGSAS